MKYLVSYTKVGTIRVDQKMARQCYNESVKITKSPYAPTKGLHVISTPVAIDMDPRMYFWERQPQPIGDLKKIILDPDPAHRTKISTDLSQELECKLTAFLRLNADLFAWTPANMPRIDPDFICHNLMIDPRSKPVIQKKRKMGEEKREVVCTETQSLLEAGFIREIQYTTWQTRS
jgi:hypothetical protein